MIASYEMRHQVPYYECDATGHQTLAMLFRLLILASEAHSDALRVGTAKVKEYDGGWVIINYAGNVDRLPQENETVMIKTYLEAYNRFFVVRTFEVYDEEGKQLVKVKGTFAFMNLTTRKVASIPEPLIAPYHSEESRRLPKVARPKLMEEDLDWVRLDYRVRFFDIDLNNHVNNAVYFDWLLDPLGDDFLRHHRLVGLKMKYDHEVRAGEKVDSQFIKVEDEGRIITHHQIKRQGEIAAEAEFEWKLV